LVFAAAPDLESGDIPLSPMFLPLVHTSVSYLASAGGAHRRSDNPVGKPLFFDLPHSRGVSSQWVIRDPQGQPQKPVVFEGTQGEPQVICERPRLVGVYKLMSDTTLVSDAVVNVDTRESNLSHSSLPEDEDGKASVVETGEDFLDNLEEKRQGREIFAFFVLLAAAALVAESVLGRSA
jgi:hypothetical protein